MFNKSRNYYEDYADEVMKEIKKLLNAEDVSYREVLDYELEIMIGGFSFYLGVGEYDRGSVRVVFDQRIETSWNWNKRKSARVFEGMTYEITGNAYMQDLKKQLKERIAQIRFKSIFEKSSDGFIGLLASKLLKTGKTEHLGEILDAIKEKFNLKTKDDIDLEMMESYPALFNERWEDEMGILIHKKDEEMFYYYHYEKKKLVSMKGQFG